MTKDRPLLIGAVFCWWYTKEKMKTKVKFDATRASNEIIGFVMLKLKELEQKFPKRSYSGKWHVTSKHIFFYYKKVP